MSHLNTSQPISMEKKSGSSEHFSTHLKEESEEQVLSKLVIINLCISMDKKEAQVL